jgi:hypothetical protein
MSKKFPWKGILNTRQGFEGMDAADFPPYGPFTAVTTTPGPTSLWVPGLWTPIAANDARAGKAYLCRFGGIYTSTATQGVLTWGIYWGQNATIGSNTLLGTSGTAAPPASITAGNFYGEFVVGIQSLGLTATSAKAWANGLVVVGGSATTNASAVLYTPGSVAQVSVDTTTAQGVSVGLTISVASQSYTCEWVTLQSMN